MRTIDIINEIINQSIDYRNIYDDESFYASFYSINKLIYYGQVEMLKKYNTPLIDDVIIADKTGPFIQKTTALFAKYNFDKITEKQKIELILPPSIKAIIEDVIKKYGNLTDSEISIITKREKPWLDAMNNKSNNEITIEMLKKTIELSRNQISNKKLKKKF